MQHPHEVAYLGIWPSVGPDGKSLDTVRTMRANTPMVGAWALVEYRGDWKWHAEVMGLAYFYKATSICHLCAASTRPGATQ